MPFANTYFLQEISHLNQEVPSWDQFHSNHFYLLNSLNIDPVCLSWMITIWNVTASIARSGCILVPSEWKLTGRRPFPGGSSVSHWQPRRIKRQSLFVQVFRIGPAPDIFLNKTKWRTIWWITTFFPLLRFRSDSRIFRRLPHFLGIPLPALLCYTCVLRTKAHFSCLDVMYVNMNA